MNTISARNTKNIFKLYLKMIQVFFLKSCSGYIAFTLVLCAIVNSHIKLY